MNPQDLIATLKSQHKLLQSDLASTLEEASNQNWINSEKISELLTKFKTDLLEHLKLEDEEFYPNYLSKKNNLKADITSEDAFYKQMDDIAKAVTSFLDKYSTPEIIRNSSTDFKQELSGIIQTLNLRIETEEDGIFEIYLTL